MKNNSFSVEQLKQLQQGSSLAALWLAVPMYFTLFPWARAIMTGGEGASIDIMVYTNIAAILLMLAITIALIIREKMPLISLWTVLNTAMILWWVNLVPASHLGAGGESIGIVFGVADLFILTVVLACRVLRTVDIRRIYVSTILYVIQALYLTACMAGYVSSIFTTFQN